MDGGAHFGCDRFAFSTHYAGKTIAIAQCNNACPEELRSSSKSAGAEAQL
jgi:hypothetical protein